jgi:hypothetical protein
MKEFWRRIFFAPEKSASAFACGYSVSQKKFPKKVGQTCGFAATPRQGVATFFGNFF